MAYNVSFKKGALASLPTTYAEGTLYVTTDERAIYLDISDSARIRIGDFQEFATVTALEANTNPSTSALYYVADINCLAKWDGSKYVQINLDTGATSFEVVGDGNAVTAVSYDAVTRKLTLTKGETFATKAYVGKIPENYTEETIIAYINKKAEETLNAAAGGSSESAASVLAALNTYKSENDPKVDQAQEDIDALEEKVGDTAVSAQITTAIEVLDLENTYDAKGAAAAVETKLEEYKTSNSSFTNLLAEGIAAAQDDVDKLGAKVGTVPEGNTVVGMISDAEGKLTTLIGSVDGDDTKSVRAISAEEVAKIVAGADESYDTLKEISDWISSHTTDAAAMNSAILALQAIVDGIGNTENGEKATVVAYVADAIDALKIGDYAKAADLTALAARVEAAEGKLATLTGEETVDGSVKKALKDAKDYADGLNTAMDTRVQAVEGKAHEHENKDILDGIDAAKVAAWDTAEQNAKTYTEGLLIWGEF